MKKKIIISLVSLVILASMAVMATAFYLYSSSKSFLDSNRVSTELFIEKGQSYSKLYNEIFQDTDTPAGLDIYLRKIIKLPQNMKFGYYMADNISYSEFLSNIMNGVQSTVKVTVPEGFNVFDIANALEKAGVAKKDEFLSLVFNNEYAKKVTGYDYKSLEGFLFPGTYKFPKNFKPEYVVDTMYADFKKYLPADFKEKTAAQGLTEYEAIILASIVQKETYNVFEAPIVASVYYNRLNIDMILQADPTILYGKFLRGEYEIKIGKADLRDETNIYNTYKHKGLTPTPICSPSLIALEAVANPAKTNYLFFVASKSIRLIIAEVENNKIKNIIYQEKATTRLAANINKTGILQEEPFNKSINVLAGFRKALNKYNVEKIKTVATSAVREAANGKEFINAAKNSGIEISIISGKEEGMLEYLGVCSGFDAGRQPLILDVGGGSSEIIYMQDNNELHTESHKIGVVKMADMFDFQKSSTEILEKCSAYIKEFFKDVTIPNNIQNFIATAGTATTLAAIDMEMTEYDYNKVNGYKITKEKVIEILNKVYSTPYNKRLEIKGMDKGREDLIIPGILIILEILKKTNLNIITVSDFGLREGAVVRAANS